MESGATEPDAVTINNEDPTIDVKKTDCSHHIYTMARTNELNEQR